MAQSCVLNGRISIIAGELVAAPKREAQRGVDTVNTDGTAADRSAMDLAAERLAEILADDETGRMLAAAAALPASDASAVIARIADAATARVLRERPGRPIRLSRTDRTALVGCARGLIRERIGETGGGAAFPGSRHFRRN